MALHSTRLRTANEQVELDQVQERSKQETKFDRNAAGRPDANGAYHDYESSGRDDVDEREQREAEENERAEAIEQREREQSYQTQPISSTQPTQSDSIPSTKSASPPSDQRLSMNPYAAYLNPTASPTVASPTSPRSNNPYYVAPTPIESSTADSNYNFDFLDSYTAANDSQQQATSPFRAAPTNPPIGRAGRDGVEIAIPPVSTLSLEDDEESIKTPLQPSEKALGKMKSLSYNSRDS